MIPNRLDALMNGLLNDTVFADLVAPVQHALAFVRRAASVGRVLSMERFIALGVWRQLQGMGVLREQVQALDHLRDQLAPQAESVVPLARSTWSDALASTERRAVLQAMIPVLMREVGAVLPDRLAGVPGLDGRPVRAMDGTYQEESAHYRRCTPKQGGEDNPKGHGELVFYNLRLGLAEDALVETRSRHEINLLRDYDARPGALTQEARTLWVVDRAFIDAAFWDRKKRTQGSTLITRMKSNLVVGSRAAMPIAKTPENAGVLRDERITLLSSSQEWRLITLRTRQGRRLEFLTNDFSLLPGVVAFLYARRWDEEKCFDTWKNDFAHAKAWGKSPVAIDNQVCLAIITHALVTLLLHRQFGAEGARDHKALRKQEQRQRKAPSAPDGTERPDWTVPLFRYTSKISRQVLRFFKHSLLSPASPALYEAKLRPLLEAYL
ncbi:transposase [Thiorhodovibrio litoralis]|uniref:transposase n=1 Tax=Thiorhodovibrio litoralis TaxID=2952932 RepID=UPI002B258F81|nr:transposase [Thiorhodovibrio litoralis]WPL13531.1 Transposase DDE domain protein [Thiorhodovibrio litoralis]